MQTYELFYMIPPSFSETEIDGVVQTVNGYITKTGGKTTKENRWGTRKLAYPIGQYHQAHYMLLDVELDEKRVVELDQLLRREEHVLRHLVTSVRPKTADQIEGERRLAEERMRPRTAPATEEGNPKQPRPIVPEVTVAATAPAPVSAPAAQPAVPVRSKPVSDDVTSMEDEAKQAKEKSSEPGFLQESGKTKDIAFEDLDKKIDEILKDDML